MKKLSPNTIIENSLCEAKISYSFKVPAKDRITIQSSLDTYQAFLSSWDKDTIDLFECFKVLYLNRANQVLCIQTISSGGISSTVVDPKLIFLSALKCASSSIVVCHNHPSGNRKPSTNDLTFAKKLKAGAELLDLQLLDSLIITGNNGYSSFADEGWM